MTLNEYERLPMEKLLKELRRKLWLAKTSAHAHGEKGKESIRTRGIQISVIESLLATLGEPLVESIQDRKALNALKEWSSNG